MVYKIIYKYAHSSVYMRVWTGDRVGSLAMAGLLIMNDAEFMNFRKIMEACSGFMDTIIFEEQVISSRPTRENNGFRPA